MSASNPYWVFGYGSLMWRPGFPFVERRAATLHGRRRAFCIYSVHHRGTYERPGLVLGLAPGGACRGAAYRVAEAEWPDVYAYLLERGLKTLALRMERHVANATAVARFLADRRPEPDGRAQSARNRFPGIVTRIERDGLAAIVEIGAGGHRIVSMITREAADELALEVGSPATAVVKATNVIVEGDR